MSDEGGAERSDTTKVRCEALAERRADRRKLRTALVATAQRNLGPDAPDQPVRNSRTSTRRARTRHAQRTSTGTRQARPAKRSSTDTGPLDQRLVVEQQWLGALVEVQDLSQVLDAVDETGAGPSPGGVGIDGVRRHAGQFT